MRGGSGFFFCSGGSRRFFVTVVAVVFFLCVAAVYYFFDPDGVEWMPRCLWKVTTGTDCPGCGSQRMAHALLHGDWASAWHANAFAFCLLPLIVFFCVLEVFRGRFPHLYGRCHSPVVVWILFLAVLAWWLLRNIV